jgi:hypothetical protein
MIPQRMRGGHGGDGRIDQILHEHKWLTTDQGIYGSWKWADESVSKANTGLFFLKQMEQTAERDHFIAELRFLRAFFHFWQLDLFRQFPFRREDDQNYQDPRIVLSGEEAFHWIEDELINTIPLLRDRNDTPYGRVTKAAAQMLLAKLYLNAAVYIGQPMWDKALAECNEIIRSGHYDFNPDYFAIFGADNHDNSEAILVIRNDRFANKFGIMSNWRISLHYYTPIAGMGWGDWTGGFNGPVVVPEFIYTWDEDDEPSNGISNSDVRYYDDRIKTQTGANLGFLIGLQFMPDGSPLEDNILSTPDDFVQMDHTIECPLEAAQWNEGVRVIKYEPDYLSSNVGFQDPNDVMIFRYADLWLMAAEAKFRGGNEAQALIDINTLRDLRGAPLLNSLTEQDILNERGFELYWEGWRRQDLIRFDQFTRPWANRDQSNKYREVFPIPVVALDANPNLKQNPGY